MLHSRVWTVHSRKFRIMTEGHGTAVKLIAIEFVLVVRMSLRAQRASSDAAA
jgi:hypothetical protein